MTSIRQNRRADILKAACDDFCESSFDRSRMENIARRAGIGKSTIYEYFPSKTDLLQAVVEWVIEQACQELSRIFNAETDFRSMVSEYLVYMSNLIGKAGPGMMTLRGNEPVFETIHSCGERFRDFLVENIAEAIRRAAARGEVSGKIEPTAAALLIVSMSSPMIAPAGYDMEQVLEVLFEGLEPR